MAKLIVLYGTPADSDAFDRYYAGTHVRIAKRIPGLRAYDVSAGGVGSPTGSSPYHLVASLSFDSVADIQAAFASPEGQAAAADLANFATGSVEMLVFEEAAV